MCVEGKETEKKKERDELFFSVCYRSAQFDFFHIYIAVTERKLKKKWKEEKNRVQRQQHSFFSIVYVCSSSSSSVFFFLYVCALLASANTSMRARVDR